MHEWNIKVMAWPYSGTTQEEVGDEVKSFSLKNVENFETACRFADVFLKGIRCNPKIWEARVISVDMVR